MRAIVEVRSGVSLKCKKTFGIVLERPKKKTTRGPLSCPVALYRETTLGTYKSSKISRVRPIPDQKSHKKRHQNVYLHEQEPI